MSSSPNSTIKFLCSYNGKILPRYPDAKLRYLGGQTRLLSVDRSISFSDLLVKLGELCGSSVTVTVRCQLPTEDLDALVTVTSDEDLVNLIEVYDRESTRQSKSLKIKAFLKVSSTATGSSASTGSPKSPLAAAKPPVTPSYVKFAGAGKVNCYAYGYGNPSWSNYLVHNGNYWQ